MTAIRPMARVFFGAAALALVASVVPLQAQDNGPYVTSLYIAVLHRDPDPSGWFYYKGLLDTNRLTRDQETGAFLTAPEYTTNPNGVCPSASQSGSAGNRNFLVCLYAGALNRYPSPGDFNLWQGPLDSGAYSRNYVVEQIIAGTEFLNLQASRLAYHTAYVTVGGVDPANSSGAPGASQQFIMHYLDPDGPDFVSFGRILFNSNPAGPDGNGSCPLVWNTAGSLILEGPSPYPTIWGTFGGANQGLSNVNCVVDTANSRLTRTQGGWDVTVLVSFTPQFSNTTAVHRIYGQGGNQEGLVPPWLDAGSWTQSYAAPPPTPTLIDTSDSAISPNFVVGDSFSLSISAGAPFANRAVTLSATLNGTNMGTSTAGLSDNNGNFIFTGTKNTVGAWSEQWYLGGVAAGSNLTYYVVPAPTGYDVTAASIPGSFTAGAPSLSCSDISGTWNSMDQYGNGVMWVLDQFGNGTLSFKDYRSISGIQTYCGMVAFDVSGQNAGASFSLTATNPNPSVDGCGYAISTVFTEAVTLSGNTCSTGAGTYGAIHPSRTRTLPSVRPFRLLMRCPQFPAKSHNRHDLTLGQQ